MKNPQTPPSDIGMLTGPRVEKFRDVVTQRQSGFIVVVEDIRDPHNAAAVFRTCDAFGIQQVHLIFDKQPEFDPKSVGKETSASANKWLDFSVFGSTADCYGHLRGLGYTIVATALTPDAVPFYEQEYTQDRIALVIGNEHAGLSEYAVRESDIRVVIPMRGFVQSLNLSVTTAVCIAEITRQRMLTPVKFSLGDDAKNALLDSFVSRSRG